MVLRTHLIGKEAVKPFDNNDWSGKHRLSPDDSGNLTQTKISLMAYIVKK